MDNNLERGRERKLEGISHLQAQMKLNEINIRGDALGRDRIKNASTKYEKFQKQGAQNEKDKFQIRDREKRMSSSANCLAVLIKQS